MFVHGCRNSFEFERQTALSQEVNTVKAAFVTAGSSSQRLVGFFRAAVQCNFNRKWRPITQVIGCSFGNQCSVCKQGYEKSFSLRVRIDFQKIFTCEYLASRIQ